MTTRVYKLNKRPIWVEDDGGRSAAGLKGRVGDCVVRAVAIAAELPYDKVYKDLHEAKVAHAETSRDKWAKFYRRKPEKLHPDKGVGRPIYDKYLKAIGFKWVPTMAIGQGCRVHLRRDELPSGRLVVRVSRHLVAMIDGVIHDTHNPDRGGDRCVYGYYIKS